MRTYFDTVIIVINMMTGEVSIMFVGLFSGTRIYRNVNMQRIVALQRLADQKFVVPMWQPVKTGTLKKYIYHRNAHFGQ